MHHQTEHAMRHCRTNDLLPIRRTWAKNTEAYVLRAANGEKRWIFTGTAHTALANAHWPKWGKNAVLWLAANQSGQAEAA